MFEIYLLHNPDEFMGVVVDEYIEVIGVIDVDINCVKAKFIKI